MSIASAFKARARVLASSGGLGLACSPGGVHVAVVRRVLEGRPQILACHAFEGDAALTHAAHWRRKHGWMGTQANLLLAPNDYQIFPIELPEVPAAERAGVARWKVKDMIDFAADEASVDCLMVPGGEMGSGRPQAALAVVAPRPSVARWMERSHAAKLHLHAIDIPELALRNLAALNAGMGACGLLHVGIERSALVMVWQGELCSFRRFEVGAAQLLQALPEEREAILERLALDLQRTSDAFERQFYAAALGPMRVIEEIEGLALAETLSRHVSSRILPFKLHEHLDIKTDSALVDVPSGIDHVLALGAALRDESDE